MKERKTKDKEFNKRVDAIIQTLCDFYGITHERLFLGGSRSKSLGRIRAILAYKLKVGLDMTWTEVAEVMKLSDQGVVFAVQRVEENPGLMTEYQNVLEEL